MAHPIEFEAPAYDARETLRKRLEAAPTEHAEALLEGYELLQQLHRTGTLRLLTGALASGSQILETAVDAARSPEAIRATRNAILLGKMLAAIDPEILAAITEAASDTLSSVAPNGAGERAADKAEAKPPGLIAILGGLRRKESRRGLALIGRFLDRLGARISLHGQRPL